MNKLDVQPGRAYITTNNKTAFISGKSASASVGFVSGQGFKPYEWLDDATNIGDDNFNLIEEAQIEITNQQRFAYWRVECIDMLDAIEEGQLLWACMLQWARLMEKKIIASQKVKPHELAEEAGLFEHDAGEYAITILFQCWKYGDILMSIGDYRPYCKLG